MGNGLDVKNIFKKLKNREITPEEALRLFKKFEKIPKEVKSPGTQEARNTENNLEQKLKADIVAFISKIVDVIEDDIDLNSEISEFGFDSVSIVTFTGWINEKFNLDINPAVFFEHRTAASFVNYLKNDFGDVLEKYYEDRYTQCQQNTEADTREIDQKTVDLEQIKRIITSESLALRKNYDKKVLKDEIAIIGVSGVFPQSEDIEKFWENLEEGRDLIREIPADRWDWKKYFGDPKSMPNKTNVKWGGFMDEVDKFDPLYFGISPKEAELMDPQQRIFLETVYKTIEDAGYKPSDLAGSKTGLYVGVATLDYNELIKEKSPDFNAHNATGIAHSILANRNSYLFDFHGPSEPIDTACSSSLVAIHHAVEGILNGDCDIAIAGGVNVMITPTLFISFSKAGMLCEDGRCKAFDKSANGYVRGEGSGAILLKPLSKALADGDNIYAVIKGTSVNHGGKANSLTAPNPNAQADLIVTAWKKAGVDPGTVGYIEAHGTGTSLGDPIEINGLKKAFAKLYREWGREKPEKPHCGIGSVKTNIGHLETAAGIAGVIKVILAMKNKIIPKSLHLKELNPYIKLEGSPFFIADKKMEWTRLPDRNGIEAPRRAGISSFGFGGVNSHIVLEEYEGKNDIKRDVNAVPAVVVLSAADMDRLKEYAARLKKYIGKIIKLKDGHKPVLSDIAYTLQVGREVKDIRLAFIATDLKEVIEKLNRFLNDEIEPDIFVGNAASKNLQGDEQQIDLKDFVCTLPYMEKLAESWAKGDSVNWKKIYLNCFPKRVPLPTYPFARERYWVPDEIVKGTTNVSRPSLHPLLDENISTLERQCFKKVFSKDDPLVVHHVVGNKRILPGAVYVEIARAAGQISSGGKKVNAIRDIIWKKPLIIEEEQKEIEISLYPSNGGVEFEISSSVEPQGLLAVGTIVFSQEDKATEKPGRIDLEQVKERCHDRKTKDECYTNFKKAGLNYGETFKTIISLYGGKNEALAYLSIQGKQEGQCDDYLLYSSIIDGAMQSVIGISISDKEQDGLYLPYSIDSLDIYDSVNEECCIYVTRDKEKHSDVESRKYNIYIMDTEGQIKSVITGFSTRLSRQVILNGEDKNETLFYKPAWNEAPLNPDYSEHKKSENILLFDLDEDLFDQMKNDRQWRGFNTVLVKPGKDFSKISSLIYEINSGDDGDYTKLINELKTNNFVVDRIIYLWAVKGQSNYENEIQKQLDMSIYPVFYLTRALSQSKLKVPVMIYNIYEYGKDGEPIGEAILAFGKAVNKENPNIRFTSLGLEYIDKSLKDNSSMFIEKLHMEISARYNSGNNIRYKNGQRFVKENREIGTGETAIGAHSFKEKGVYVITGGMGGIGSVIAMYLARCYSARLVLCGRSEQNTRIKEKIDGMKVAGSQIIYMKADIANKDEAKSVVEKAVDAFGKIDGVIHCAGLIRDSFVIGKTNINFKDVLAPKVLGTFWLDQALAPYEIDFFMAFSSVSSVYGNIGQSDYCFANSFMDSFVRYRNAIGRSGRSISINWPLLKDGNMGVSKDRENIIGNMGLVPMDGNEVVKVVEKAVKLNMENLMVLYGRKSAIEKSIQYQESRLMDQDVNTSQSGGSEQLYRIKAEAFLKSVISKEVKLPVEKIDGAKQLQEYGIDSLMIMNLNRELEKYFGLLSKTLFFEYQTVNELSIYFSTNHKATLNGMLSEKEKSGADVKNSIEEKSLYSVEKHQHESVPYKERQRFLYRDDAGVNSINSSEDIAIIGISGRYPMADDLDEFWENLKNGKDCITEIPADRWDIEEYCQPDENGVVKTRCKWGGFIRDVDKFDPLFFNISPKEARYMDPQERLFLETVWHVIEDAGYSKTNLEKSRTGVFVGAMYGQYQLFGVEESLKGNPMGVASFYASIANRISYFFNFSGPSMAIDTMCSSSLTSIHLACDSLRKGEVDMAVAGGVNVTVHPSKYIILSQSNFISPEGRCRSFGKGGEGYVPGEGVGAVLLKTYSKALEDGDRIYALIKASSLNHGGKTNGFSVPNPNAQADLIVSTLRKSNIDPRTISYMEAHGTGTSLGDPIEITGLTKAYSEFCDNKQFCPIGSVKSNVGHMESAAGIAGLTKIVLQMKNKMLVPTIHSQVLNPNIDFENSPFFVQRGLDEWKDLGVEVGSKESNELRRAAISSFGAGGSNAYIIIEEYDFKYENREKEDGPFIIPLSARNDDRLIALCKNLKSFLSKNNCLWLQDISFTLSTGRESMEERMAFIVNDLEDLKEKLGSVLNGETPEGVIRGNALKNKSIISVLTGDREAEEMVKRWMDKSNLVKLAELWVNGLTIDWSLLPQFKSCVKVSIPGYPFARERYWLPLSEGKYSSGTKIHPLIDKVNYGESINSGLVFEKIIRKNERVIKDHKVGDSPVLPGAAYIEMVLAAGSLALEDGNIHLADVAWINPFMVEQDEKKLKLSLSREKDICRFELSSLDKDKSQLHAKGEMYITREDNPPVLIDLQEIISRCGTFLCSQEIYRIFEKGGLNYGWYYRVLESIRTNGHEALSEIRLSERHEKELPEYKLHPAVLDGALQTISGIYATGGMDVQGTAVPFSVEEIEFIKSPGKVSYAYARVSGKDRFHVAVLDEKGSLCIRLFDLTLRRIKDNFSNFFYTPFWKNVQLSNIRGEDYIETEDNSKEGKILIIYSQEASSLKKALAAHDAQKLVVQVKLGKKNRRYFENVYEVNTLDADAIPSTLEQINGISEIYFLGAVGENKQDDIDELKRVEEAGIISFFRLVKYINHNIFRFRNIRVKVITNDISVINGDETIKPYGASITGFVMSAAKEFSDMRFSMIDIEMEKLKTEKLKLIEMIVSEPYSKLTSVVAFRDGKRFERKLRMVDLPAVKESPFKENGVYLIIGGAGGIGFELSKYLAARYRARLIWIGRSNLGKEQEEKLNKIKESGGDAIYLKADVSGLASMKEAVEKSLEHFGCINGVFHSAIVLQDKSIGNMDEETLRSVLKPKVEGSIILQKALSGIKLDFMVFFSSVQSFAANVGQSNYAAACTFKDAVSQYYNQTESCPVWTINWGYWGSTGVVAGEDYRKRMASFGIHSIEPAEGIEAVMRIVGGPIHQVVAIKAERPVMESIGAEFDKTFRVYTKTHVPMDLVGKIVPPSIETDKIACYREGFKAITEFSELLCLNQFRKMGVFLNSFESITREDLKNKLNILPVYSRLFDELLEILARGRFIQLEGSLIKGADGINKEAGLSDNDLYRMKESLKLQYPDLRAHIKLLWECLSNLTGILAGRLKATEVIFPGTSMEMVESIYRGNLFSDYFNTIVTLCVEKYVSYFKSLGLDEKLCILEVGAGTGGTSAGVLEALKRYQDSIHYEYTDISQGFIQYGRKNFGQKYEFTHFQILDIERDALEQGYERDSFHMVIATNVLHATRNIKNTLNNIKPLLKSGGWLIVNEITALSSIATLTFGLLEGWWLYEDPENRIKGSPLLNVNTWKAVLVEEGFIMKESFGINYNDGEDAGQNVIVAQSNGMVIEKAGKSSVVHDGLKVEQSRAAAIYNQQVENEGNSVEKQNGNNPVVIETVGTVVHTDLLKYIQSIIVKGLSINLGVKPEDISLDRQFSEYGVDSITGLEFVKYINNELDIALRTTVIFDYGNVTDLAVYIKDSFGGTIKV